MARKLDVERIEKVRSRRRREQKEQILDEDDAKLAALEKDRRGELKIIEPVAAMAEDTSKKKLRVGAYIRVSTQEDQQQGSLNGQRTHFRQEIEENPNYELVKIYEDDGISGTQIENRKGFQEMIAAAQNGELDLILTKSMTRFGRNAADILATLKLLDNLNPPVPVIFETDNISTTDGKSKLIISIMAALSELESQLKSEAIRAGIVYRMREGTYKFSVNNTLGFERSKHGYLKIIEEEAEIVRYIYEEFIAGASPTQIAAALTESGISTPTGKKPIWRPETVKGILSNEKYCGDVIYQKTYTPSYIKHKSKRNKGVLRKWQWTGRHTAIVDKEIWNKAQELLESGTWRRNRATPLVREKGFVITRVRSGKLAGFYLLDPAWNKEEREKFLDIVKAEIQENSNSERNYNNERF
jgi:DNA invertase Pin-like site-specific DNA recombinase